MADVISLDKKLKIAQNAKDAIVKRRKIQAVQKVFQCIHCAFKCEKCGTQIDPHGGDAAEKRHHRVPYRFCRGCAEEYIDYIEKLKGGGDREAYWRNSAWMDLWKTWIDYQSSLDRYLKSKEFIQLMQDLKQEDL